MKKRNSIAIERVCVALVAGFLAYLKQYGLRETLGIAREMLLGVGLAILQKSRRTSRSERAHRRAACNNCPRRFEMLDTCGVPGRTDPTTGQSDGCWCAIPIAIFVKAKQCPDADLGDDKWEYHEPKKKEVHPG